MLVRNNQCGWEVWLAAPSPRCATEHVVLPLQRAREKQSRGEKGRTHPISPRESRQALGVAVLQCEALLGKERKQHFLSLLHRRRVGLYCTASASSWVTDGFYFQKTTPLTWAGSFMHLTRPSAHGAGARQPPRWMPEMC